MQNPIMPHTGKKPNVNIKPFGVKLHRLTEQEIARYTRLSTSSIVTNTDKAPVKPKVKVAHIQLNKLQLNEGQWIKLVIPTKAAPKLMPAGNLTKISPRKRLINGRPSAVLNIHPKQHTFRVRTFGLPKHKNKYFFKCQVTGCNKAYLTFKSACEWNTHHQIYHWKLRIACGTCNKKFITLSAARGPLL